MRRYDQWPGPTPAPSPIIDHLRTPMAAQPCPGPDKISLKYSNFSPHGHQGNNKLYNWLNSQCSNPQLFKLFHLHPTKNSYTFDCPTLLSFLKMFMVYIDVIKRMTMHKLDRKCLDSGINGNAMITSFVVLKQIRYVHQTTELPKSRLLKRRSNQFASISFLSQDYTYNCCQL